MGDKRHAFLPSRTGATFGAEIHDDPDGAITIVTNDGHGYRSAHRGYAAEYFGHVRLWRVSNLSFINSSNARVRLTTWKPTNHDDDTEG